MLFSFSAKYEISAAIGSAVPGKPSLQVLRDSCRFLGSGR